MRVTVYAGVINGVQGRQPPPSSWAADPNNEVSVWLIELKEEGKFVLPRAKGGDAINRSVYFLEGRCVLVAGSEFKKHNRVDVRASADTEIAHGGCSRCALFYSILILQYHAKVLTKSYLRILHVQTQI